MTSSEHQMISVHIFLTKKAINIAYRKAENPVYLIKLI